MKSLLRDLHHQIFPQAIELKVTPSQTLTAKEDGLFHTDNGPVVPPKTNARHINLDHLLHQALIKIIDNKKNYTI